MLVWAPAVEATCFQTENVRCRMRLCVSSRPPAPLPRTVPDPANSAACRPPCDGSPPTREHRGRPVALRAALLACAVWLMLLRAGPATAQGFSVGVRLDFATGSGPVSVAIGDLNGDGKPDLAVANINSATVSVLLGNGAGGVGAKPDFATAAGPISVAIGDLNGDGKPDLAVANASTTTVSVLLGNGAGGFGAKTDFPTGINPQSVAIGDLNGDGKPDLAAANGISSTVSVLLGNGAGDRRVGKECRSRRRPHP